MDKCRLILKCRITTRMRPIKIGKNRFYNLWKISDLDKDKIFSSNSNSPLLIIVTNKIYCPPLLCFPIRLCIIKILPLTWPLQLLLMAALPLFLIVIVTLWLLRLLIITGAAETSLRLQWIISKLTNLQKFNLLSTRRGLPQVWIRKWLLKMNI